MGKHQEGVVGGKGRAKGRVLGKGGGSKRVEQPDCLPCKGLARRLTPRAGSAGAL